jgi:hypothetical protein
MKKYIGLLAAGLALTLVPGMVSAQDSHKTTKKSVAKHVVKHKKPKKLKSVPAHTEQASKNVNHEANRESKDFNHTVGKPVDTGSKKTNKAANGLSKNVNHEANRESKDFNHSLNNASKSINHAFQPKKKKKE